MEAATGLPEPGAEELRRLLGNRERLEAYRILYEAGERGEALTMVQIRERMEAALGAAHAQTDRRVRDLREHFIVTAAKQQGEFRYSLVGRAEPRPQSLRRRISSRVEAEVFTRYNNRCAMCGESPQHHGVRLVIDHMVPLAWGGSNDSDNLQPLCDRHNHGKQAFYATFDEHGDRIRAAIGRATPHERIGELLKAFDGGEVPGDLIALVAREENRGDPTRRLRELRALGWRISVSRRKEGRRTNSYYRLEHWEPWPPEGPRAAINRLEAARKRRKRTEEAA